MAAGNTLLSITDKIFRLKIANESLDVYAPLAHRLGMYSVKKELEDLGFKH